MKHDACASSCSARIASLVMALTKVARGLSVTRVIAMRLGPPPKGYANWTLRLLARKVVELEIVETISHETVRRTLKKTG